VTKNQGVDIPMNRILQIVLLASLSIVLFSGGCQNVTTTQPKEIWTTDQAGNINTNNLERIQSITPFTIVIPKYLPEELKKYPVWVIKENYVDSPETTTIRLQYDNRSSTNTKFVDISENNAIETGFFKISKHNDIVVSGIEVSEVERVGNTQFAENTHEWDFNKIHFSCNVIGYSQTEARKIVASMIEKIN
jgi:hypothetical protein